MWFVQVNKQLTVSPRNFVVVIIGGNLLSNLLFNSVRFLFLVTNLMKCVLSRFNEEKSHLIFEKQY